MTTSNHNITSYTAYLEEIAEESDGAESLLDYDDVPYPDVPTNGGGIPVHAVAAEEIGGSNDNDNLPNLEQVLQEVTEIFRNTSRLNEIVDSSHEDGESLPLQHVRNEHDDDGYSYNSSLCSSETTEGHVAHLEAALQNHSAMKVQVCNILRSRQQPQLQDELLLGSDASVSASSSVHLIDSVIISDDTYDCNSSASSSSSSSSSSLSLLVSPNVSPKRLQRQSSDCGKVDIGGTAPSAVNTSGVSSLTSTPFRVSPNKNHHPESSAVPHTNGVYNAAVNTTVPSLAARRKVTVVVRVCPTKNKEADTSSHCLVNPSSDEVANGDNENEGRFKGGIIAVNPSAFGSYECPNIQMVLNLSRMVDELENESSCDWAKRFFFDDVVWSDGTNGQKSLSKEDSVLDDLAGTVVEDALGRCINSVCFAHGVRGSGKSHAMFGVKGCTSHGLLPKIVEILLSRMPSNGYRVNISFLEICDEDSVRDLLALPTSTNKQQGLIVRDHNDGRGAVVDNLSEIKLQTMNGLMRCLSSYLHNKSSNSHVFATIKVFRKSESDDPILIQLVDLAGSEGAEELIGLGHVNKSAGQPVSFVRKSLTDLGVLLRGRVNLSTNSPTSISFRGSLLTKLLKRALNKNSHMVMIANVCPLSTSYKNSMQTLRFASSLIRYRNSAEKSPFKEKKINERNGKKSNVVFAQRRTKAMVKSPEDLLVGVGDSGRSKAKQYLHKSVCVDPRQRVGKISTQNQTSRFSLERHKSCPNSASEMKTCHSKPLLAMPVPVTPGDDNSGNQEMVSIIDKALSITVAHRDSTSAKVGNSINNVNDSRMQLRLMLQELLEERDQAVLKQNIAQFCTKQAISELEVMKVELQCSQSSLISAYDNQAPLISQIEQLKVERAETAHTFRVYQQEVSSIKSAHEQKEIEIRRMRELLSQKEATLEHASSAFENFKILTGNMLEMLEIDRREERASRDAEFQATENELQKVQATLSEQEKLIKKLKAENDIKRELPACEARDALVPLESDRDAAIADEKADELRISESANLIEQPTLRSRELQSGMKHADEQGHLEEGLEEARFKASWTTESLAQVKAELTSAEKFMKIMIRAMNLLYSSKPDVCCNIEEQHNDERRHLEEELQEARFEAFQATKSLAQVKTELTYAEEFTKILIDAMNLLHSPKPDVCCNGLEADGSEY